MINKFGLAILARFHIEYPATFRHNSDIMIPESIPRELEARRAGASGLKIPMTMCYVE